MQPWEGKVFINPPYGRSIGLWVRKAFEESARGALVVCLLPARTDTRWWQDYAHGAAISIFCGGDCGSGMRSMPHPSPVPSSP